MRQHSRKFAIKKIMVLLLAISFLTLSLSGQHSVIAASKIDISKQVQLEWIVLGNGQQTDTQLVEKAVNKYLKDKINATLKLTTFTWGDDFENKMAAKVASGEEYDITFTANWAMNYRKYAKVGAFVDITNMMDTYAPKTKAFLGKNLLKGAEVDGRVYAIPFFSTSPFTSHGILLNKKMVEKYKVDTSKIKKLEDLEPIFKKIKAKQPKILDFYPLDTSGYDGVYNFLNYNKLYNSTIPGALSKTGKSSKVINEYETPETKSLFSLMNKWYKSGYINKSIKADYSYFQDNISNIFAFYSNLHPMRCQDILNQYDVYTVAVELTKPTINTNNSTGSMQAISSTSKNPERALMFLELVNTDAKLSNMINYGIEGVHYKKTGTKNISQLSPRFEKYNPSTSWMFGNESITYSLPGNNPKLWEKVINSTKNAVASQLLGFSFDSEPVSSQIADLNNVVNKYYIDLSMGKINPAVNLPKMNTELKKAGLQKVLTEMQKQVDGFVKNR